MKPRHLLASALACTVGSLAAQSPPGVVNAPVAPEAIYAAMSGARPGISVIDLNGFGQGTGDPANTRFPLNPNLGRPGVFPPLALGVSALDAGSAGALTLTRDHLGSTLLIGAPALDGVTDLELGQPLDLVFNNERINRYASSANQVNPATGEIQPGNTIMVAPHPNPPRLVFPPPHPAAGIGAEEPTTTSSVGPPGRVLTMSPPCLSSPPNLLVIGNPFATTPVEIGLFGANFPGVFYGPQPPSPISPPPPTAFCPFTSRQQIGHFLYALDRAGQRIVVLNSNRFTVLDTIDVPDPVDIAISPNLRWLAVSSSATATVKFIDADPLSPTFHRVRESTPVSAGPTALAWQPDGEDLLVCSPSSGTLSILDARSFRVRRTIQLTAPHDVAVTARQIGFGRNTWTWFAWVLDGDRVHVYESGPDRVGPDAIVASAGPFPSATVVQPDVTALGGAVWVAHRDSFDLGQISRVELETPSGPRLMHDVPPVRSLVVTLRVGGVLPMPTVPVRDLFSGNQLVDLAFDEINNAGGFPDMPSLLRPDAPQARHSSKGHVRLTAGGPVAAVAPRFLFVAAADAGKVDVVDIATGFKLTSLDLPGVTALASYWRQ